MDKKLTPVYAARQQKHNPPIRWREALKEAPYRGVGVEREWRRAYAAELVRLGQALPARAPTPGRKGGVSTAVAILVREAFPGQSRSWREAATREGVSVTEFIRRGADERAGKIAT